MYYEYKTEIPPDDALQKMEGTFFNKHIGKAGYLVELTSGEVKETFTCRENLILGNRHDCLWAKGNDFSLFDGKVAIVWWFDQEIYPFIHQRRLVRLVVDNKEEVSRAKTIADAETSISLGSWIAIGLLIFIVFLAYYFEFHVLRRIE
ncbi:MAG: hypothetical protein LBU46_04515, partial [Candidatus Accumulibacter sp.]|nr:hypothetical protein [Accumulibacter sp.]